ncbi:hypothetical protein EDB82DRAFT_356854 [Fusarium venenatum]|uniref:uncharacterized protein n=1 Tax=Fusarium venenatum TaxID=56646 RepID=UPI001DD0B95C|nr:hypothetical protein EDB82DRAFT_356854 [Fusarium venenatum]
MTHACFEYTSGTSRPSLSVRCRNMVYDSPVISTIVSFTHDESLGSATASHKVTKLESLEREILTLYSKGLASPLDTDQYGDTHAKILFSMCFGSRFHSSVDSWVTISEWILQDETLTYTFVSCIRTLLQANYSDAEMLSFDGTPLNGYTYTNFFQLHRRLSCWPQSHEIRT